MQGALSLFTLVMTLFFVWLGHQRNRRVCMWLAATMGWLNVQGMLDIPILLAADWVTPLYDRISWFTDLLSLPLVGLTLLHLVAVKPRSLRRDLIHLTLFVLLITLAIVFENALWPLEAIVGVSAVYVVGVLGWSVFAIHRYNTLLMQVYSCTEEREVKMLYHVVIGFVIIFALWTVSILFPTDAVVSLVHLMTMVVFGLVAYAMYHLKEQPHDLLLEEDREEERPKPANATEAMRHQRETQPRHYALVERMVALEKEGLFYRKSDLSLNELAEMCCTNRTYLSDYLNKELGMSFFEYINNFRVEETARMLEETNMTVEEIAKQVGFSSAQTLRRIFQERYKNSPTAYRRERAEMKHQQMQQHVGKESLVEES